MKILGLLVACFAVFFLLFPGKAFGQETPPIPESKGECSVIAGIMVGVGLMLGAPGEVLAQAEQRTFERCLSGESDQILKAIRSMVQMAQDLQRVREDCAFQVGRESYKGSLMSSGASRKAIEDCVSLKWDSRGKR